MRFGFLTLTGGKKRSRKVVFLGLPQKMIEQTDEILDIFDENEQWIGTATREEAHRKGLRHRTFHCWVVRNHDETPQILFQKRAENKKICPSLYDVSAAGHLAAGESIADGVREIREELGLETTCDALTFLKVHVSNTVEPNGLIDREFHYIHFLYDATPLRLYNFQKSEISGLLEVSLPEAAAFFADTRDETRVLRGKSVTTENRTEFETVVHSGDFVHRDASYYPMIFEAAMQFLARRTSGNL